MGKVWRRWGIGRFGNVVSKLKRTDLSLWCVNLPRTETSLTLSIQWIDSCCINKRSSAELSEAINSMFRWYQNAQVCYAYLSDVHATADSSHHYRDDSEFRRSKWFTRGWTLQELLAPEIVVFYTHEWVEIGTKAFMGSLISSITKIDESFLTGAMEAKHACVAQKMSWASKRKTMRLEDTAYCLMGLFDLNMPLLYGEGKKAFHRLQLEIIRNSSDESIFAWGQAATDTIPKASESRFYGLLAEDPGKFEGSGDVISGYSFRPPYTMTSKGLQMEVGLIPRCDDAAMAGTPSFADAQYPKWILSLHCHRREDDSKHLAIYLIEGEEGLGWARVSDWLLSSRCSPRKESFNSEWRQIIIQAVQDEVSTSPLQASFLLEVKSVLSNGYLALARMNHDAPVHFGRAGQSRSTAHHFTPVTANFRLSLRCSKPNDSFCLIITRQPEKSRKVGFCIRLEGQESGFHHDDRVFLPSGKVRSGPSSSSGGALLRILNPPPSLLPSRTHYPARAYLCGLPAFGRFLIVSLSHHGTSKTAIATSKT